MRRLDQEPAGEEGENLQGSARQAGRLYAVRDYTHPLLTLGRFLVWFVVMTAGIKPTEIFGPGEQSLSDPPTVDLAFRLLILLASVTAFGLSLSLGRLKRATLTFLPFLLWAFTIAVIRQSDLSSAKQIGSYASWIFLYAAAAALLDRPGDYRKLTTIVVIGLGLSALGAVVQHGLGYGPALGSRWPDGSDMEFMRTHTGSGGILLDTFAPYCAAILLLSNAGSSWKRHVAAWLFVLWGAGNILRGGLLALAVGLTWFLWNASSSTRRRVLPLMAVALLCGGVLFGPTIAGKLSSTDDVVNTSGRFDVWPQLAGWIAEQPLLGHGPDADMELLAESAAGRDLRAAHNELLSTGVNYGVTGILLLWGPLVLLLAQAMRRNRRALAAMDESLSGATAVLLMVVVLSLTDNTLRTPGIMILALVPTAVAASFSYSQKLAPARDPGANDSTLKRASNSYGFRSAAENGAYLG